jgi:hypothetical protein
MRLATSFYLDIFFLTYSLITNNKLEYKRLKYSKNQKKILNSNKLFNIIVRV